MALTRKYLKAMGIEDEKIDQIIEAHTDTVNALKEERDNYKTDAEKLPDVQRELDELKAKGDDGYKEKYEKERSDFEAYKTEVANKESRVAKENAYRELLKSAGIKETHIETLADTRAAQGDIDGIELKDGAIVDADKLVSALKERWSGYVVTTETRTAGIETPPANTGGGGKTKDEILAIKDGTERRRAMAQNPELFGIKLSE